MRKFKTLYIQLKNNHNKVTILAQTSDKKTVKQTSYNIFDLKFVIALILYCDCFQIEYNTLIFLNKLIHIDP